MKWRHILMYNYVICFHNTNYELIINTIYIIHIHIIILTIKKKITQIEHFNE